jgi:hypothetical protein
MIGWHSIKFLTNGWKENKEIITDIIKPTVEELEKSGDITSFFFLEYYGSDEQKVTFVFHGDKDKVLGQLRKFRTVDDKSINDYDPKSENYRFGEDYMLGIKLFELGSRLALCSIDNKNPIDKSSGQEIPIIIALRHVFLQNLGYTTQEEKVLSQHFDPCLLHFSQLCKNTKIK